MIPERLDFLMMVAGVPFVGFAAACLTLSREVHERVRWEWLGAFSALICGHIWLQLGMLVSPAWQLQTVQNLTLLAAYVCLFAFALTGQRPGWRARIAGAYLVVAAICCALLCTRTAAGFLATAVLAGIPATLMACWALHRWAAHEPRLPRALATTIEAVLPFVVLTQLLLEFPLGPDPNQPTWAAGVIFLLVGTVLAGVTATLNGYYLRRHIAGFARTYAFHAALLILLLFLIIVGGWLLTEEVTRLQCRELQSSAEDRDLPIATAIRSAHHLGTRIAVALSAEPAVAAAAAAPRSADIDAANTELDRYTQAFNCEVAYLLDAAGNVLATSNRDTPDSLLGRSVAHREYFRKAIAGEPQTSILLGNLTRSRGLYAAAPIFAGNRRTIGVVAVKSGLEDLEGELDPDSDVMLVDPAGKIWMSSKRRWLYQQLWPAPSVTATAQPIEHVDRRFDSPLAGPPESGSVISFASRPHVVIKTPAGPSGFMLISLVSMQSVLRARGVLLLITATASTLAILVAAAMRLRTDSAISRQQQQSLSTSLGEMERVMSVLSHDLRSPLAASKATVDYLLMNENLDSECKGYLQTIGDEQMRMSDMVTRLLDAIRIRSGGVEWQWEPINVPTVIESAYRTIAALPQRRTEVNVELQIDSLPAKMKGDAQAIQRLIVNLGANAVRHTYHGAVSVRVCAMQNGTGEWLKIAIRDSGEGIEPAVLPLLGKPFVLGGKSSAAGSGLGLAISSGICAAYGGKLTVRSKRGEGSTFTAWLRADLEQPIRARIPPGQAMIEVV